MCGTNATRTMGDSCIGFVAASRCTRRWRVCCYRRRQCGARAEASSHVRNARAHSVPLSLFPLRPQYVLRHNLSLHVTSIICVRLPFCALRCAPADGDDGDVNRRLRPSALQLARSPVACVRRGFLRTHSAAQITKIGQKVGENVYTLRWKGWGYVSATSCAPLSLRFRASALAGAATFRRPLRSNA